MFFMKIYANQNYLFKFKFRTFIFKITWQLIYLGRFTDDKIIQSQSMLVIIRKYLYLNVFYANLCKLELPF